MRLNKLLSQGKIGTMELKNRFVVPPMGTNFGTYEGMVTDEMIAYYDARFGSPEHLPPVPDSLEELVSLTMHMAEITVRDEKIVKTRKLLSIEQFRDERARDLATKHFLTGIRDMFTYLFTGMMDKGLPRRDDPAMLAFAYTSPITALIHLCDRAPEKTEDALARIEAFSRHFCRIYGGKE